MRAEGVVTYDTRFISTIASRVAGRLEETRLKYPYQQVRKGEKLLEIYSADLVTAQRELLYVVANDPSNDQLIRGARQKLSIYGMSDDQIDKLIQRREVAYRFPVYSSVDGYVVPPDQEAPTFSRSSLPASTSGDMDAMSSGSSTPDNFASASTENVSNLVREGDYVRQGESLFRIVSAKALRVELNLPARLGSSIKRGDVVHLDFMDDHTSKAVVDFIQPFFDQGEQFVKIRIYIEYMPNMHIGHLVDATIRLGEKEGLWIPREAVVDLGLNDIVFLKQGDMFVGKPVTTGISEGGMIQVISGLTSQGEFAINGQFLVDSESFIKTED
jgi:hypothetical protein